MLSPVAELPDIKTIKANINAAAKALQMIDGGSLAAAKRAVTADLDPKERELLEGTTTGKRCALSFRASPEKGRSNDTTAFVASIGQSKNEEVSL